MSVKDFDFERSSAFVLGEKKNHYNVQRSYNLIQIQNLKNEARTSSFKDSVYYYYIYDLPIITTKIYKLLISTNEKVHFYMMRTLT